MKKIPTAITQAITQGITLRDYAVLVALVTNANTPMTRQDLEGVTGLGESVVRCSTKRLVAMELISRDKKHEVGGSRRRAAKYLIKQQAP